MCDNPARLRHLVDRAMRIAKAHRTVTCLILPNDAQEMDAVEEPPRSHGTVHSGIGYEEPRVVPYEHDLRRAAEVLNSGERVAILVGAGARRARLEVERTADLLGAGSPRPCSGARSSRTTNPTAPARSVCWARSRAGRS